MVALFAMVAILIVSNEKYFQLYFEHWTKNGSCFTKTLDCTVINQEITNTTNLPRFSYNCLSKLPRYTIKCKSIFRSIFIFLSLFLSIRFSLFASIALFLLILHFSPFPYPRAISLFPYMWFSLLRSSPAATGNNGSIRSLLELHHHHKS